MKKLFTTIVFLILLAGIVYATCPDDDGVFGPECLDATNIGSTLDNIKFQEILLKDPNTVLASVGTDDTKRGQILNKLSELAATSAEAKKAIQKIDVATLKNVENLEKVAEHLSKTQRSDIDADHLTFQVLINLQKGDIKNLDGINKGELAEALSSRLALQTTTKESEIKQKPSEFNLNNLKDGSRLVKRDSGGYTLYNGHQGLDLSNGNIDGCNVIATLDGKGWEVIRTSADSSTEDTEVIIYDSTGEIVQKGKIEKGSVGTLKVEGGVIEARNAKVCMDSSCEKTLSGKNLRLEYDSDNKLKSISNIDNDGPAEGLTGNHVYFNQDGTLSMEKPSSDCSYYVSILPKGGNVWLTSNKIDVSGGPEVIVKNALGPAKQYLSNLPNDFELKVSEGSKLSVIGPTDDDFQTIQTKDGHFNLKKDANGVVELEAEDIQTTPKFYLGFPDNKLYLRTATDDNEFELKFTPSKSEFKVSELDGLFVGHKLTKDKTLEYSCKSSVGINTEFTLLNKGKYFEFEETGSFDNLMVSYVDDSGDNKLRASGTEVIGGRYNEKGVALEYDVSMSVQDGTDELTELNNRWNTLKTDKYSLALFGNPAQLGYERQHLQRNNFVSVFGYDNKKKNVEFINEINLEGNFNGYPFKLDSDLGGGALFPTGPSEPEGTVKGTLDLKNAIFLRDLKMETNSRFGVGVELTVNGMTMGMEEDSDGKVTQTLKIGPKEVTEGKAIPIGIAGDDSMLISSPKFKSIVRLDKVEGTTGPIPGYSLFDYATEQEKSALEAIKTLTTETNTKGLSFELRKLLSEAEPVLIEETRAKSQTRAEYLKILTKLEKLGIRFKGSTGVATDSLDNYDGLDYLRDITSVDGVTESTEPAAQTYSTTIKPNTLKFAETVVSFQVDDTTAKGETSKKTFTFKVETDDETERRVVVKANGKFYSAEVNDGKATVDLPSGANVDYYAVGKQDGETLTFQASSTTLSDDTKTTNAQETAQNLETIKKNIQLFNMLEVTTLTSQLLSPYSSSPYSSISFGFTDALTYDASLDPSYNPDTDLYGLSLTLGLGEYSSLFTIDLTSTETDEGTTDLSTKIELPQVTTDAISEKYANAETWDVDIDGTIYLYNNVGEELGKVSQTDSNFKDIQTALNNRYNTFDVPEIDLSGVADSKVRKIAQADVQPDKQALEQLGTLGNTVAAMKAKIIRDMTYLIADFKEEEGKKVYINQIESEKEKLESGVDYNFKDFLSYTYFEEDLDTLSEFKSELKDVTEDLEEDKAKVQELNEKNSQESTTQNYKRYIPGTANYVISNGVVLSLSGGIELKNDYSIDVGSAYTHAYDENNPQATEEDKDLIASAVAEMYQAFTASKSDCQITNKGMIVQDGEKHVYAEVNGNIYVMDKNKGWHKAESYSKWWLNSALSTEDLAKLKKKS